MVDITLVLVPLLVLPIVLLFRFIGCGLSVVATGVFPPPNYRDYILSDPAATAPGTVRAHPEVHPDRNDVIAYWRLLEERPSDDPHATHSSEARDETGAHHGSYFGATIAPEASTPSTPGSEQSASGESFKYRTDALIDSAPNSLSRTFIGGYVRVKPSDALYPEQFTIEAWVKSHWGPQFDTGFEHTLFAAGGFYQRPNDPGVPKGHGFAVVVDRNGHWQVRFNGVGDLFTGMTPGLQFTETRTHLAVTVAKESGKTRARLFYNGKPSAVSDLVFYSPPHGAPLLIGVNSKQTNPLIAEVPHRPVVAAIQEVVLHRKALSAEEIANHYDINRLV